MTHLNGHQLAMRALDDLGVPRENGGGRLSLAARVLLAGREVPDLMGTFEAAQRLGTTTSNLDSLRGLPDPVLSLRCGRIWRAEDIERFAGERKRRNRA